MLLSMRRRRIAKAVACVTAIVGVLAIGPPAAVSQSGGSYTAVADARLYSVNFTTVPGVAFDQLVDAGVGVAQSQLDSLGQSSSFASNLYPSESVVLLPGLFAGLTGGQTSGVLPEYPLIASSSHPVRPSQRIEAGPVVLTARSDSTTGEGSSRDGGNHAIASVSFDEPSRTVVARSESSIGTQRISDVLTMHGVRSFAEVRQSADGEIERESGLEISALTILGQRVALNTESSELLGEETPVGLGGVATLDPLLDALAADGITIETFPADETGDGVRSAGLTIRAIHPAPPQLASGVESVVAEVTIGGNAVRVENRAFEDVVNSFTETPPGDVALGPQASASPAAGVPENSATGPASDPSASLGPIEPTSLLAAPTNISVAQIYPVLFAAGCALVGIVNLFRHLAVRTP